MTNAKIRNAAIAAVLVALFAVGIALLSGALSNAAALERQDAETAMLRRAMPGGKTFAAEAYTGDDPSIAAVWRTQGGAVIETVVAGYADDITLLVGVNDSGRVVGVSVRSLRETPGLGGRAATDAEFLGQFVGLGGTLALGDHVDGLTGATVTSRAVVRGVNAAIRFMTGADTGSSVTGETDADSSATEWTGEETPRPEQSDADSSATEWTESPGPAGSPSEQPPLYQNDPADAGSSATEWEE